MPDVKPVADSHNMHVCILKHILFFVYCIMELINMYSGFEKSFSGSLDTDKTYVKIYEDLPLKMYNVTYVVKYNKKYCDTCINGVKKCCPHFVMVIGKDIETNGQVDCHKQN